MNRNLFYFKPKRYKQEFNLKLVDPAGAENIDITILNPLNNTVSINSVDINWTMNLTNTPWCIYSLDGGANNTDICVEWQFKQDITIQNNFSIDMVNAPIRINLARELPSFNKNDFASNGEDIRFKENDTELLSFVELWKPDENQVRPRILSRLTSFIKVSKRYDKLPHLSSLAEQILKKLETQWPDAKPLDPYPAFVVD